jgi:hypothetical protein
MQHPDAASSCLSHPSQPHQPASQPLQPASQPLQPASSYHRARCTLHCTALHCTPLSLAHCRSISQPRLILPHLPVSLDSPCHALPVSLALLLVPGSEVGSTQVPGMLTHWALRRLDGGEDSRYMSTWLPAGSIRSVGRCQLQPSDLVGGGEGRGQIEIDWMMVGWLVE